MENNPNTTFEVVESSNVSVVLQKKINNKNKSRKEIRQITESLPTATVYYFTHSDYAELKRIEKEIKEKIEVRKTTSVAKRLAEFLEL